MLHVAGKYNINIRELAENVPKSLECGYILTKGNNHAKNAALFYVYTIKEEHICPDICDNDYESKDNYNFINNNYEDKIDIDKYINFSANMNQAMRVVIQESILR